MGEPIDDELRALPGWMAAQVRALLPGVDLPGYRRFLDHMVHYTRGSGERLRTAAAQAPDPAQRDFFAELARDEASHFRLAEADLAAFGEAPSGSPPSGVVAFDRSWRGWSTPERIGALFALESVGAHLAVDAALHLGRLGLGRDQARFILVHLHADVGHAAATVAQLDVALRATRAGGPAAIGPAGVRDAARVAATFWVDLHADAFRAE